MGSGPSKISSESASISIIPEGSQESRSPKHRSNLLDHQMIVDGFMNQEKKDPTKWTKIVSKETNVKLETVEIDPKTGAPFLVPYVEIHPKTGATIPIPSLKIKEEIIETYIIPENSKLKEKWNPSIREDEPGIFTTLNPF
jgi:hypothetical protein